MDKSNRDKPIVAKNSTIKTLTYGQVLANLESVKREYKEYLRDHRKTLYQFLQRAAETTLSVEADENTKSRLRKKMGEKDVLRGVLIFIFDAKSESETKKASKRALALSYLIEKLKVAVEDIATAIPKHGGIEKLARLAAESRQDSDQDRDDEDDGQEDDRREDETEETDESVEANHTFGRQIRVGLSPKLTKKLNQFADKTRIKIIGYVRAPPDELPTIEAKKLIEVEANKKNGKSKTEAADKKPDDNERDWEE